MGVVRVTDHIRRHLLSRLVLDEPVGHRQDSLESMHKTEWSDEFEQHMRRRLIMGAFRYGKLKEKGKPQYSRIASAKQRMDLYLETGNLEHVVDAANMLLLEYEEPIHPNAHFESADDGIHTELIEENK